MKSLNLADLPQFCEKHQVAEASILPVILCIHLAEIIIGDVYNQKSMFLKVGKAKFKAVRQLYELIVDTECKATLKI